MVELDVESLVEDIENGKSLFITGEAGVGKTHLLKTLFKRLTNVGFKVALTSTTGINALNLGGMTIHKLTGIGINTNPSYIKFMKKSFLYSGIKKRMEKIDVIIIDEVSMLRADQFELINSLLQSIFDNTKPFGGMTMIFTGDFFQIPPVVKS
jgi:DNA replication protein DnaC